MGLKVAWSTGRNLRMSLPSCATRRRRWVTASMRCNVTARFEPPARVSWRLLRDVHKDVFNDISYREGGSCAGRNSWLGASAPLE